MPCGLGVAEDAAEKAVEDRGANHDSSVGSVWLEVHPLSFSHSTISVRTGQPFQFSSGDISLISIIADISNHFWQWQHWTA